MKKIFILLLFLWGIAEAQPVPGYTYVPHRLRYEGGSFNDLLVPAGTTAARGTGTWNRSGALFYDSTGADSGLYVYHRPYWVKVPASKTFSQLLNENNVADTNINLSRVVLDDPGNTGISVADAPHNFTAYMNSGIDANLNTVGSNFSTWNGGAVMLHVNNGDGLWDPTMRWSDQGTEAIGPLFSTSTLYLQHTILGTRADSLLVITGSDDVRTIAKEDLYSFRNGVYDSSGIVGIGAGVENKSTFGSWRYINTNGNRLYFKSRTSSALLWVDSSLAGGAAQLDLQGPYGGVINLKSDTTARTTNAIQWEKQGVVQVVVGNDIGPSTHHFFIDLYGSTTSINLESGGSAFAQFGTAAQYLALTAGGRLNIGSSGTIGGQTANIIGTQSVSDSVLFTSLVRLTDTTGFDVLMRNRTTGNLKMMYPGILGGGGNVTKVGTPADNQIGVWTGDGTIEGGSNFTWTGNTLALTPASGSAVISMTSSAGAFTTTFTYDASRNFISDYRDGNIIRNNGSNVGSWTSTGLSVNPGGGTAADFTVRSAGFNPFVFVDVSANAMGVAQSTPSAYLHLGAGTATAGTAPLKITEGVKTTVAVDGQVEKDDAFYMTKTNAVRYGVGGALTSVTASVGNVGAGEDDLQTYSIPAGTLSQDGDYIDFAMSFTVAVNSTLKVYYGATQLFSFAALATDAVYRVTGQVVRTGAATQRATFQMTGGSGTIVTGYQLPTETLSGAVTLKATGEGASNNDIVQTLTTVRYFPAN